MDILINTATFDTLVADLHSLIPAGLGELVDPDEIVWKLMEGGIFPDAIAGMCDEVTHHEPMVAQASKTAGCKKFS